MIFIGDKLLLNVKDNVIFFMLLQLGNEIFKE